MRISRARLAAVLTAVAIHAAAFGAVAAGPDPANVYRAVRDNDLTALKTLIVDRAAANQPGVLGFTPLMTAAFAGSTDAMRMLIDGGADVNAQNQFGTTALMLAVPNLAKTRLLLDRGANPNIVSKQGHTALFLAAMTDASADVVRLLLAKGADINARDAFGNTVLTAAAAGNDMATVKLAAGAGIDVNAAGPDGPTPLIAAAYNGNVGAVKMLLAKGANVNTQGRPGLTALEMPKSGPIALGAASPLMIAAAWPSPELVKLLIDAGADVNARDARKMTPLMFAIATNHQDAAVIKLLLDRGADATAQSGAGETAVDWARKMANPIALGLLKVSASAASAASEPVPAHAGDVRSAAERAMALLETSSQAFFNGSGCVSCHHQNITDLAASEVKAKGLKVDADAAIGRMKMLEQGPPPQLILERMDPGVPEIFASTLVALAANNMPPNPVTDILVASVAASQLTSGSWRAINGISQRPPAEEGEISRVALCIRALKAYGAPARAAEMRDRIEKARKWLEAATPLTAEERNMKLLGLAWAGADLSIRKPLAAAILAAQQSDGGWRQHPGLASDAYATGQSLYALAKAGGISPNDAAYQKGVKFLLATQDDSGAWRVTSRSPKFQAYFNSAFPFAGNQWISAWATGWATMALAQAVPPQASTPVTAAQR